MVSVCMATYNGERFIGEQLTSILKQLQADDELIISDDRSVDNTISIINALNDPRIKLFHHEPKGRPTENFQHALEQAKGEYVFLADQDDIWLDHKYNRTLSLLKTNDLVLSNSILVDEDKQVLHPSFFEFHGSRKGIVSNVIKNSYFGSCMAFRRSVLDYALPFPPSREVGHDVWLGLVAEIVGKVYFDNEPLIMYRRHAQAVTSHGMAKSDRSLFKKVFGRLIMFRYVYEFYKKYKLNGKRISINHNSNV